MKRIYITAILVCAFSWTACGRAVQLSVPNAGTLSGDSPARRAVKNKKSNVQIEDEGVAVRLLPDDNDGSRHQRFLVRLSPNQTVLIAYNVDIAPRVAGLQEGDRVRFYGEYIWNEQGGLVHWTHHAPKGRHVAGWLKHNGRVYQ